MKRARFVRVGVVALVVAGSVAYSLSRHTVTARPAVVVMTVTPLAGATASLSIEDSSGGAEAIDSTNRMGACDPEVTSTPSRFAIGSGIAQPVTIACAPLAAYTMKRCQFQASEGSAAVVAYSGICMARAATSLTPSALSTQLAARAGTTSSAQSIAFTTPIEMKALSVQIDDQDDIFDVQTPCDTPSGCNDFAEPTPAGASFKLDFACHPPDSNPHSAHAYVLTDSGAGAAVRLDCNVAASGAKPLAPGSDGLTFGMDTGAITDMDAPPDAPNMFFDAPGEGGGSDAPTMFFDAPGEGGGSDAPTMFFDAPGEGGGSDAPTMFLDAPVDSPGMSMISVMPTVVMVNAVVGGNGSADVTFAEVGTASVTITSFSITGPGAAQWSVVPEGLCSIVPCALGPTQSAPFHAIYTPTIPNATDTATLTFDSTDATSPTMVALIGTAMPADANIALVGTPDPLVFSDVQVNQFAQLGFSLQNTGTGTLDEVDYGSLAPPFSIAPSPPTTIGPGATVSGGIVCHPTAPGMFTQTLQITAAHALSGSPINLLLTCSTPPHIVATPPAVALSAPIPGLGTTTVTLTNMGAGPLTISSYMVNGGNGWSAALEAQCPGLPCVLGAGQSVGVDLMFSPNVLGANDAQLEVDSDDPTTPQLFVPLDGTGLGATLGASVLTLDFGQVVVGSAAQRSFQLTNGGNIAESVTYDPMFDPVFFFDMQPATVPPSGAQVTLHCMPNGVGSFGGTITITSSTALSGNPVTVNLVCQGVPQSTGPQLVVSPPSITTQANVGGTVTAMLDLSDSGAMPLTIASIALTGNSDWSIGPTCTSGCSLLANSASHQMIAATYAPTTIGPATAMLTIVSTDPASPTTVLLTGTGLGATLSVAPTSLDFGTVPVGGSAPGMLELDNAGDIQLANVTYSISGAAFSLTQMPGTVDVGSPAFVRLACSPTAGGATSGMLTIHAPDAIPPQNPTIPLTCTGLSGDLVAFPTALDFGEVRIGNTATITKTAALSSIEATLTLTQQPTLAMPVEGMTVGGVASTAITTTPMSFDVAWAPPAHEMSFATTIAAIAGNTATVAVTGKVVTPAVDPDVATPVYAGSWCLNQPTTPTNLTLTSTGTATLHVIQPALASGTAFTLGDVMPAMAGYPYALASGGAVTVSVTPVQRGTAGHVADSVAWNVDLAPPVVTPITADFVESGGVAQPSKLMFDAVVSKSDTEVVSLQNCQTTPLVFTSATVTPSDVFSIDTQPPPSLLPGIVGAVAIKFTPSHVGVVMGMLTIEAPTGTLTVELDAAGRGGAGSSGTPATFYGCGCRSSDPGGAFAFGAVLLLVRRRRSRR